MSNVQILVTGNVNVQVAPVKTFDDLSELAGKFMVAVDADDALATLHLSSAAGRVAAGVVNDDRKTIVAALGKSFLAAGVVAAAHGIQLEEVLAEVADQASKAITNEAAQLLKRGMTERGLAKVA